MSIASMGFTAGGLVAEKPGKGETAVFYPLVSVAYSPAKCYR
jgi:hypothetical protein